MHKLKTCDELHFGLIMAFLDCMGYTATKRSGSFQLILTKHLNNLLNVKCKPNSDPKANSKSNKKKQFNSCLLN